MGRAASIRPWGRQTPGLGLCPAHLIMYKATCPDVHLQSQDLASVPWSTIRLEKLHTALFSLQEHL